MRHLITLLCTAGILACSAQEIPFKLIAYDKTNRNPIAGAEVKLQDLSSLREYKVTANESGVADFMLEKGIRYRMEVSKNSTGASTGYLSYSYMLSENEVASKRVFEAELEKVKHTDAGILPAMYFEFGKATLNGENENSLDNALKIIKNFPTLQIEIGVYADCREQKEVVSKRASSIANYLATKGESKRVVVKEYGIARALNQCDCSNKLVGCSEEKYLENRRAEFKVIAF
jgi:outer membrane protein OmpA-like peptidoglycan-associated protein